MNRTCLLCGKKLTGRARKYCPEPCREAAKRQQAQACVERDSRTVRQRCGVCRSMFAVVTASKYCSDECVAEARRVQRRADYEADPAAASVRTKRKKVRRVERRWVRILERFGDACGRCGLSFPRGVYDLHHVNGKKDRSHTPTTVIANRNETVFAVMLEEVVLLCACCHRLAHVDSAHGTRSSKPQAVYMRRKRERRWSLLIEKKGDHCADCGATYPRQVYDLHHPEGDRKGGELPSKILVAAESRFWRMVDEVVVLCVNCHRLRHARETAHHAGTRPALRR